MSNNRVFYACHAVSIDGAFVRGAQSVGMNTTFDLEPIFQLGQLKKIDTVTLTPQVELTVSRVLENSNPVLTGTFEQIFEDADHQVCVSIGDDTAPLLVSPSASIHCTGAGVTGVTYNFPVDGTFTEEITFLGDSKSVGGCSVEADEIEDTAAQIVPTRQYYQSGAPSLVTNAGNLTNVSISTSPGREFMYKLGSYKSFHSYVNTPAEVTIEFEVTATSTDQIGWVEASACAGPTGDAFNPEDISINICGSTFTMEKCKLSNITYGGGDTGGGNATINFTYVTFNSLTIS
tara:strand:- start:5522 stop:6391 length:870 start_codon:yes stop_codon:yes gene_type:complete